MIRETLSYLILLTICFPACKIRMTTANCALRGDTHMVLYGPEFFYAVLYLIVSSCCKEGPVNCNINHEHHS